MSSPFSRLGFQFQLHFQFNSRYFCNSSIDDPLMFIKYVRYQCELGFNNLQFPLNLFNQMMSLVHRPSIVDFNRLLAAMLRLKRLQPHSTVISLYSHLDLSGIRPDLHSMCILANCYCRLGRVDFGYSFLGKSLKLGYPFESNLVFFTTLINGFVQNDRLPDAVKLLDVAVVKLGIQPSIVTYGTMVKGLCRTGDNERALHLLRQMNSDPEGCKPNLIIYTTLIDSLCKHKLVTEALKLFSIMKTEGIKPDVFTYTSLIRGMLNLGRKGEASEMLGEMVQSNAAPDVTTYSMLIDMHCKEGMVDEAVAILPIMIKRGLSPDVVTYSALLDGYCSCGQMDKARDLMDLM
ncbi:uncharacterized protein LOC141612496 isoform X2 [Silene latifolia]